MKERKKPMLKNALSDLILKYTRMQHAPLSDEGVPVDEVISDLFSLRDICEERGRY